MNFEEAMMHVVKYEKTQRKIWPDDVIMEMYQNQILITGTEAVALPFTSDDVIADDWVLVKKTYSDLLQDCVMGSSETMLTEDNVKALVKDFKALMRDICFKDDVTFSEHNKKIDLIVGDKLK